IRRSQGSGALSSASGARGSRSARHARRHARARSGSYGPGRVRPQRPRRIARDAVGLGPGAPVTIIARTAGAVSLALGLGLAILAFRIFERQFALAHDLQLSAIFFVMGCVLLASFCLMAGYRFLFNRPNRHGSLLSPRGWKILAGCFAVPAVAMAAIAL